MQTTADLSEAAKSVPGIEVLTEPPAGAKRMFGPYWPDEAERLKDTLRNLRNRREMIVAPDSPETLSIYRRPRK